MELGQFIKDNLPDYDAKANDWVKSTGQIADKYVIGIEVEESFPEWYFSEAFAAYEAKRDTELKEAINELLAEQRCNCLRNARNHSIDEFEDSILNAKQPKFDVEAYSFLPEYATSEKLEKVFKKYE